MLDQESLAWVRAGLPSAPARLLEVGAGEGELAAQLRADGYEVRAIDPGGGGDGVEQVALLDVDAADGEFDAAVAMLSLHHVEPLEESLARLAAVLRPGAPLVVDEFDVASFDRSAAAWLLARWHEQGREVHGDAGSLTTDVRDHLHPVALIRERLIEAGFDLGDAERVPYLHRWHLEPGLRDDEVGLIEAGRLPATGVRFVAMSREGEALAI
jgi:2-polyprenyl-3-methyl-5-hydroxy-6-metoxy-1,4-benzoquinol methylase